MAQTPSPRDHDADANPDISRKRPRLSEEYHSPVHIETLDLEEVGNSFVDAIEIEDDDNMPQLYSDDFAIDRHSNASPLEQVRHFRKECQSDQSVNSSHVYHVSLWLERHLDRTAEVDHDVLLQRYLQDETFFSILAQACSFLLYRRGEPFDEVLGTSFPAPRDILHQFLRALQILSIRFIQLLPNITNDRISRRDSAQLKGGQHRVLALYYLHVLRALLVRYVEAPLLRLAQASLAIDAKKLARQGHAQLLKHGGTLESLVLTFGNLARNARDVSEAWDFMNSILLLIHSFILDSGSGRHELDSMVDIVNCYVLPAIREKHPRALPEEFHAHVVLATSTALRARILFLDVPLVYQLYERLVKGEGDALLVTHPPEDGPSFDALWATCNKNQELLAEHICTAWTLQTTKSFLFSDIIDVRTCGIGLLTSQLRTSYSEILEPNGPNHPLVQYTARFLRVNELTKYVFGAESHASLVGSSGNIVCFLAVAQAYTNQETDILWEAATHSAEVEFAKASCGVLRQVCQYLDKDRLLYLARQYATTSVSRIGPDVIELLPMIFQRISTFTPADATQESKLASAFVSLEILRHIKPNTANPSTNVLRHRAIAELSRYVSFCADDRSAIYKTCIADLSARTENGTTSAEVLGLFLAKNTTSTEVEKLLEVLPVDTAVNELCAFVQRVANSGGAHIYTALSTRLNLILLLMYLTPSSHDTTVEDRLFTFLLGDLSLDMYAREEAWKVLKKSAKSLHSAQRLLDRFLGKFVPTLNANLATPYLIEIMLEPLQGRLAPDALDNTQYLLAYPLWSALVRFSLHCDISEVNDVATKALCDLLFVHARNFEAKKTMVNVQVHFVQDLVDKLCNDYSELESHKDDSKSLQFRRSIYLLSTLLSASRTTQSHFVPPDKTDTILIGTSEAAKMITFKMQIHSSQRQAKIVEVRANDSATVAQLAHAIQDFTGLSEHRVIVSGKTIDLESNAHLTLPSVGIHDTAMIMISPRYTFNCDLGAILTSPGPIEEIITEQYHRIECLVDGPQEGHFPVAKTAHDFLKTLRPSRVARNRVISADTATTQLFSATQPYRTLHSLHVLECQLRDFANLGVIDEAFILRTVHHLVTFLLELHVEPYILLQVFHVLKAFLCEIPAPSEAQPILEHPSSFVDRILVLFASYINLISEPRHDPCLPFLVRLMHPTFLEALRKDHKAWICFTEDIRTRDIVGQLLLLGNDDLAVLFSREIFDFCKEESSPENAIEFYWSIIEATIPKALKCIAWPNAVFDLALSLLNIRKCDEADLRNLIQSLITRLWSHDHDESPDLPVPDAAILGLLRLLWAALCILRKFKKPLAQDELSINIFERLLFPCTKVVSTEQSDFRPLICGDSREVAFDIVRMTCETSTELEKLTAAAQKAMLVLTTSNIQVYPGTEEWVRAPMKCSGLVNLGMTCYMNSLLQQLFANLQFRQFILDTPIAHDEQQVLLRNVQHLFGNMQGSSKSCAETQDLAKALDVQIDSQEDVHGFFATFFSKMEENMPSTTKKQELAKFFTGKFITQIKGACGHVSTQTEPFIDISITVKNKASLQESLHEFVQGEPMQGANKYRCLTCTSEEGNGRLVDAMKRTCLDDVPDNVTFCLKRFTFEAMMGLEGKANDRFEFPAEIDLAGYQRSHLQQIDLPVTPDVFELVGVIVHQGSLEFGHYWSYIRIGGSMDPSKWFLVEDKTVKPVMGGVREVQEQCFGGLMYTNGNERADNAYVLLYQRANRFHERYDVVQRIRGDARHLPFLPPHVPVPAELGERISSANDWQYRIAHLFEPQYASFVDWLLESTAMLSAPTSDLTSDVDDEAAACVAREESAVITIAQATASYVLRVVACDPAGQKRLASFSASLDKALEAIPQLTQLLLAALTADDVAFSAVWRSENWQCRAATSRMILGWLQKLKAQDETSYRKQVSKVIAAHSMMLGTQLELLYSHWPEYLDFIIEIAKSGPYETALIHRAEYIEWTLSVLLLEYEPVAARSQNRLLAKAISNKALDMGLLFDLLFGLLNEHVDMSDQKDNHWKATNLSRSDDETLVGISPRYFQLFLQDIRIGKSTVIALLATASRHCRPLREWRDSGPGKFFARLADDCERSDVFLPIEQSILYRLEDEADSLIQLLHIVLHLCLVRDDHEMTRIMNSVAKNVLQWTNIEGEILDLWSHAFPLAPVATIAAIPAWAMRYLAKTKKPKVRQRTALFLCEALFDSPPLNANECDVIRVRVTRTLVTKLLPHLATAYGRELERRQCEEMIQVVEHAGRYLEALHTDVKNVLDAGDDQAKARLLSRALLTEYDESRSVRTEIKRLLHDIADWISEPHHDESPLARTHSKRSMDASVASEREFEGPELEEDDVDEESFVSDGSNDMSLELVV